MRRPQFLGRLLLGLVLALSPLVSLQSAQQRPNFLILFADDQRSDTIAAWGNRHIRTPHLDRLVRRGMSFRANYCLGSNSGAVCIPSRAMLMSGRAWFGLRNDLGGALLLPEYLGAHGYRTFATGKWHNGRDSFARGFQDGRSVHFGGMADHTQTAVVDFSRTGFTPQRIASRFSSEEFADSAIRFLQDSRQEDPPFFCYVAFTAPHDPRNPPSESVAPYYRRKPPLPANFLPQHPFDNGWMRGLRDENLAPYPRTPEVIREQLAEYYGLISHLDSQVGRILDALSRSPQAANTYVIYAADHGLALGSHGLLGKQSLYEHSMRCPLVIAGPGIPAGSSTRKFTYLFDLFPTVIDLAGLPARPDVSGHSLQPLWSTPETPWRESVLLAMTDTIRSVRDDRWKLIVYPPIHRQQLFDLHNDPDERSDLSADPIHAPTLARLTTLLQARQRDFGDFQPLTAQVRKPDTIDLSRDYLRKPDSWQPSWIVEKYFSPTPTR